MLTHVLSSRLVLSCLLLPAFSSCLACSARLSYQCVNVVFLPAPPLQRALDLDGDGEVDQDDALTALDQVPPPTHYSMT